MRTFFLIAFAVFSSSVSIYAQDIITLKNGDDIKAKVVEVGIEELKYKKYENLDGPVYAILKYNVLMVRYENGTKDIFLNDNENKDLPDYAFDKKATIPMENLHVKGVHDAHLNYKGKNSGAAWTAATSILFSPLLGLVPAIACSTTVPDDDNLNYKSSELMNMPDYNMAYTTEAHKIKKKKVWKAFAAGSGAWLLLILLL